MSPSMFTVLRRAFAGAILLLSLLAAPAMAADTQPPTLTVTPSGPDQSGAYFSGKVDLTLAATDNGGGKVDGLACELDNSGNVQTINTNQASVTRTIQNAFTTAGRHTWACSAVDNANNRSATVTGTIYIDKDAPTVAAVAAPSVTHNGNITITLSATDPDLPGGFAGSGVKSIQWTANNLGGSGSVLNGNTLTLTVSNTGTTTVTYSATDKVNNTRSDKTITVVIDKTKPTVASTLTPASGISNTGVTASFTATETGGAGLARFDFTDNGAVTPFTFGPGQNTFTFDASYSVEGRHVLTVVATDNAGNVSDTSTATVLVDKTAPVAGASAAPSGGGQAVTISATDPPAGTPAGASGVKSITYSVDGGGSTTVTGASTTLPAFTSGSHTVTYTATDNAGNTSAPKTITVVSDTTAPTTSAVANPASPSNQTITVTVTAQDEVGGSGVKSIATSVNGGPADSANGATKTLTFSAEGTYTVTYTATDNAGNTSAPKTITVVVDKTAPTVTATPSPAATSDNTVALNFAANDTGGAGVESITVTVDGGTPVTYTNPTAMIQLTSQGRFVVTYTAKDRAGNTSAPQTITIVVDKTAPVANAVASPATTSNGTITVNVGATDPAIPGGAGSGVKSLSLSVDGAPAATVNGSSASQVFTTEGTHTVTYTATDNVGNTSAPRTITVVIDKTAPTVTATPSPGTVSNGTITLALAASDTGGSGVASITTVTNGGAPVTTNAANATRAFSAEGRYVVSYTATDAAGNTSAPQTITLLVDKTAPTAIAVASPSGVSNGTITVSVSATDPDISGGAGSGVKSVTTSVNGGAPTTTNASTASLSFSAEGTYTVTYTATDNAGNTSAPKTITVVIDKTAPTGSFSGASSRVVYASGDGGGATHELLSGSASDNRGVTQVQVRFVGEDTLTTKTVTAACPACGSTATPVTWSVDLSTLRVPGDTYRTTIIVRDQAGNVRQLDGPSLELR